VKINWEGTRETHKRNRVDFVSTSTGGGRNTVTQKGDVKVGTDTKPIVVEPTVDKNIKISEPEISEAKEKLLKELAESQPKKDVEMEKATGDIKPEDKKKDEQAGFAKASPNFKEIPTRTVADEQEADEAVERNKIADEAENKGAE
jgi:hypothetical protein